MTKFKLSNNSKNTLIISLGDPAGIGTEITLKALSSKRLNKNIKTILVGCKNNIYTTYQMLIKKGINNIPNPDKLDIVDIPIDKKVIPDYKYFTQYEIKY